jgi:hypothetical protein|tara:strand:- start:250 stop:612 length:363 start_codon:yes stop_codon:yes gene_type:complete
MTQLYLFEKEEVMKQKDYVAEIMQEWYDVMDLENVQVQPKTSTMLGQILTKYDIKPKDQLSKDNLFDMYMNTSGGDFEVFWQGLSQEEKEYIDYKRQQMRDKYYTERGLYDTNSKSLLKG